MARSKKTPEKPAAPKKEVPTTPTRPTYTVVWSGKREDKHLVPLQTLGRGANTFKNR